MMMTKLVMIHLAKLGIGGLIAGLLLLESPALGLPDGWIKGMLLVYFGWESHSLLSSLVGGLVPPDANSSNAYIHFFHSAHLYFNRAPTAKDMIKLITRETGESK